MANTVKHRTLGLLRVGKYILNNHNAYPVRPEFLALRIQKVVLIARANHCEIVLDCQIWHFGHVLLMTKG